MSVRAKFYVVENKGLESDPEQHNITLQAVTDSDPKSENHTFWKYTPAGQVTLYTINPGAWEQFEIGKQFYVDFTPAD